MSNFFLKYYNCNDNHSLKNNYNVFHSESGPAYISDFNLWWIYNGNDISRLEIICNEPLINFNYKNYITGALNHIQNSSMKDAIELCEKDFKRTLKLINFM